MLVMYLNCGDGDEYQYYSKLKQQRYGMYATSKEWAYHIIKNYLLATIGGYDSNIWNNLELVKEA